MTNLLFVNLKRDQTKVSLITQDATLNGHDVFHIFENRSDRKLSSYFSKTHVILAEPSLTSFTKKILEVCDVFDINYATSQTDFLFPVLDAVKHKVNIFPKIEENDDTIKFIDKINFSKILESLNLPFFKFWVPQKCEDILKIKEQYDGPIFIKPSNGSYGSGPSESQQRYSVYDYKNYKNAETLYDTLKHDKFDKTFDQTQMFGAQMMKLPYQHNIDGIYGKYIIQEQIFTNQSHVFNFYIFEGIPTITAYSRFDTNTKQFVQDNIYRSSYIPREDEDDSNLKLFMGTTLYDEFFRQINLLITTYKIRHAVVSVDFIPYKNYFVLNDWHFRTGKTISHELTKVQYKTRSFWKIINNL